MFESIRDLIHRYSYYVDEREMEKCTDLFIAEGVVTVVGKVVTNGRITMNGHDQILAWLQRLVAGGGPVGRHIVSNSIIEPVSESEATAISEMTFIRRDDEKSDWKMLEAVRYNDRFVKVDGKWKFKFREIAIF